MNILQQKKWDKYIKQKMHEKRNPKKVKNTSLREEKSAKYNGYKAVELKLNQINLANRHELTFRKMLIDFGINHIWQQPFSCEKRWVCVDFYIKTHNVVIEIDGPRHNKKKRYDAERSEYLKTKHGVSDIIRITNEQLKNQRNDIVELVLSKFM